MKKLLQFGAGNIGRSFIGRVFADNGWEVVFVDVNRELVSRLNAAGGYRILIKEEGLEDRVSLVQGVRAIDGRDEEGLIREFATADIISSSVGKQILPRLVALFCSGIEARRAVRRSSDIILAENFHQGGAWLRSRLGDCLGDTSDIGIVETSIGKMVPIMKDEDLREDPLLLFCEAYNQLILHRGGFVAAVPDFPELLLVDNIDAYVDRKLYIHNLGHAAAAFLGYAADPGKELLADAILGVEEGVREAMRQSAEALSAKYPGVFTTADLEEHIEDLIRRFKNRALGDTVFRVGRDLKRKLHRSDRIIGPIVLAEEFSLPWDAIAQAFWRAGDFAAADQGGEAFPGDQEIRNLLKEANATAVSAITGLNTMQQLDRGIILRLLSLEKS